MLNICCVKAGRKYGPEYVNILFDMVRRNLAEGFAGRFVCFTDDARGLDDGITVRELEPLPKAVHPWWNKLQLFRRGTFPQGDRVLYFDLDTVITGRLDEIASYSGPFVVLQDFFKFDRWQSAVMSWGAGFGERLWDSWVEAGCPDWEAGDQLWIQQNTGRAQFWQALFPGLFVSYKFSSGAPQKASVVCFHGEPRPHEVTTGWVPAVWKIGGITRAELDVICNTEREVYMAHVRENSKRELPWFDMKEAHDGQVSIVGGAPSVKKAVLELLRRQEAGQEIWALNGAFSWLMYQGIAPTAHLIIDARPQNLSFLRPSRFVKYYLASQCHPSLFEALKGQDVTVLHMQTAGMEEFLQDFPTDKPTHLLGGGTTVGIKAMLVAYLLGYRMIHVYGMDSSFAEDRHHIYEQGWNDGERVLDVVCGDRMFKCAPWMVTQANDFSDLAHYLIEREVTLTVNGDGLIPHIAREMMAKPEVLGADLRAMEIFRRLEDVPNPKVAELGIFAGDLSMRLLARPDLHLTMVDSWGHYLQRDRMIGTGDFHAMMTQEHQERAHRMTLERVQFAQSRVLLLRMNTAVAAQYVEDASLDLVFVDADHSYEGCAEDIENWFPKVKPGGWLCGHDYANYDWPFGEQVERAVNEFVTRTGLELQLGQHYTWFVQLPTGGLDVGK